MYIRWIGGQMKKLAITKQIGPFPQKLLSHVHCTLSGVPAWKRFLMINGVLISVAEIFKYDIHMNVSEQELLQFA